MAAEAVPTDDLPDSHFTPASSEVSLTLHAKPLAVVPADDLPQELVPEHDLPKEMKVAAMPEKSEFLGQPPGYQPRLTSGPDANMTAFLNKPILDVGKFAAEHTDPTSALSAPIRGVADVAGSLTSPGALGLIGLTGGLPGALSKVAAGAFATKAGIDTAKEVPNIIKQAEAGNTAGAVQGGTEAALNLGMAMLAAMHSLKPSAAPEMAQGAKTVVEPTGEIVQELAPADDVTRLASDSVIAKKYGEGGGLQDIATKWGRENGIKDIRVSIGEVPISKTVQQGDTFKVMLSDRDAHPTGLMHELEMHVPGENGIPLAEVLPHDDATNQTLAEAFVQGGGQPPKIPYAGAPGSSGGMVPGPGDKLAEIYNVNPEAARGAFATMRAAQIRARQIFDRNLVDLEQRLPQAADLASKKEGAAAMARVAALGGHSRIQRALGGTPADLELFHAALADSEQMGNRLKWKDLAANLKNMSEEKFADTVKNSAFDTVVSAINGKKAFRGAQVQKTYSGLIAKNDLTGARKFLASVLDKVPNAVKPIPLPGYKDAADYFKRADGAQEALDIYKTVFGDQLEKSHMENNGVLSDPKYHGPSGAYYPMRGVDDGQPQGMFAKARSALQATRNPHNFLQTGLSDQYDVTPSGFVDAFRSAISSNARNAMLDVLYNSPLFEDLSPGETAPTTKDFGNGPEPVHVEPMLGRTIISNGKIFTEPTKYTMMPQSIWNELKPIIDKQMSDESFFKRLSNLSTRLNIVGPLEPIYHTANLLGGMLTHAPIVGPAISDGAIKALASRGWRATPWTKMAWIVSEAIHGDIRDPETLAAYQRAAERGLLPSKFGTKTLSKELAGLTGADKTILPFSPFLYGPNGIDGKLRVALMRAMESMPDVTEADIRQGNSHLGIYNPALTSRFEAGLKGTGLAPFATASKTALGNGLDAVLNASRGTPYKGPVLDVAASRIAQQLAGGIGGYIGWHLLMHKAARGDWPWEDPEYKFGKIRLTPDQRASYPAIRMFGTNTDKDAYVDPVGSFVSPIPRALRLLGIAGTVDTATRGGNATQMFDAAKRDTINSLLHVTLNSPAIKILADQIFGKEPQIRSMRDRSGKPTLDLYDSRGLLAAANPFGGGIASSAKEEQEGHDLLRFLIDLSMPRVLYGPINNDWQRSFLESQQRAMENRAAAKE